MPKSETKAAAKSSKPAAEKKAPKKEAPAKEAKEAKADAKSKDAAKKAAPKTEAKKEATPKAPPMDAATKKATKAAKKKEEAARAAAAEADQRWTEMKEKYGREKALRYSMTGQFQANQPIEHPKLGWGFILNNNNDRLEVLFQDGVKILISNYNPNQKI